MLCCTDQRVYLRQNQDEEGEPSVFQRRATKPVLLWTTNKDSDELASKAEIDAHSESVMHIALPICEHSVDDTILPANAGASGNVQNQRQRSGMSLKEYFAKARARSASLSS